MSEPTRTRLIEDFSEWVFTEADLRELADILYTEDFQNFREYYDTNYPRMGSDPIGTMERYLQDFSPEDYAEMMGVVTYASDVLWRDFLAKGIEVGDEALYDVEFARFREQEGIAWLKTYILRITSPDATPEEVMAAQRCADLLFHNCDLFQELMYGMFRERLRQQVYELSQRERRVRS